MADHDVAEENYSNRNETVEAEQDADEETAKPAEESSNDVTTMD